MRRPVPLRERRIDWILLGFFAVNLVFITYVVDLEQLTIADRAHFEYPIWPPRPLVDLVHFWGDHYDPLQNARPPFWRATIWLDVLLFGPFYAAAIWAIVKGKEWIRIPAVFWSGVMFANVSILMFEELLGPLKSPSPGMVTLANFSWWAMPILTTIRFAKDHPFSQEVKMHPPR